MYRVHVTHVATNFEVKIIIFQSILQIHQLKPESQNESETKILSFKIVTESHKS